jgi:hypothetical protein
MWHVYFAKCASNGRFRPVDTTAGARLDDISVVHSPVADEVAHDLSSESNAAVAITASPSKQPTDKAVVSILPFLKSVSSDQKWNALIDNWILFELENPPKGVSSYRCQYLATAC